MKKIEFSFEQLTDELIKFYRFALQNKYFKKHPSEAEDYIRNYIFDKFFPL